MSRHDLNYSDLNPKRDPEPAWWQQALGVLVVMLAFYVFLVYLMAI